MAWRRSEPSFHRTEIRRRAILPADLHDHALAVLITHMPTPDQQFIACNRPYFHPSSALMPRPSRRCTGWKRAKGPDKERGKPLRPAEPVAVQAHPAERRWPILRAGHTSAARGPMSRNNPTVAG